MLLLLLPMSTLMLLLLAALASLVVWLRVLVRLARHYCLAAQLAARVL